MAARQSERRCEGCRQASRAPENRRQRLLSVPQRQEVQELLRRGEFGFGIVSSTTCAGRRLSGGAGDHANHRRGYSQQKRCKTKLLCGYCVVQILSAFLETWAVWETALRRAIRPSPLA